MVTPDPIPPETVAATAQASLAQAAQEQEKVTRPIDLAEAMARAVLYNLDDRVQQLDVALKSRQLETANLAGLPTLVANAGYAGRNTYDSSYSRSLLTGQPYLQYNTSVDRDLFTRDLALSWNVLDFGLSFVRAQQAADRTLAAREERRRVLARIVEEVRVAYWRALAAEYLGREMQALQKRVRSALAQSDQLVARGQTSPLAALTAQRDLYELTERIQGVEQEVAAARNQLAALMNIPPGTRFTLVRPSAPAAPALRETTSDSIRIAMRDRPEIRQALYAQRVDEREATAALLDILPGINLGVGPNYTSNSYTWANDWVSWGARLSWNLMKLVTYPTRKAEQDTREALAGERVKATVATVALQVHISRVRYELARQRAETLAQHEAIQQRLLKQVAASAATDQSGDNDLVREELTALLTRARHDVAVADVQAAYAGVMTSVGRDPYPEEAGRSLSELAANFRRKASEASAAVVADRRP